MRYVDVYRDSFGVEPICRVLQVAPSTLLRRQDTASRAQRQIGDESLKTAIGRVHAANYGVYGARKVWRQLHRDGVPVGSLHGGTVDASARPRWTDARQEASDRRSPRRAQRHTLTGLSVGFVA